MTAPSTAPTSRNATTRRHGRPSEAQLIDARWRARHAFVDLREDRGAIIAADAAQLRYAADLDRAAAHLARALAAMDARGEPTAVTRYATLRALGISTATALWLIA